MIHTDVLKLLSMVLLSVALGTACAPSPRQRPLDTSPVETGAGTLAEARKQIEGSWTLTSFTSYSPTGEATPIKASGRLVYDAFGNLELTGAFENSADVARAGMQPLSFKGRAVIDPARRIIVLADVEGNVPASVVPQEMSPDRVRHYAVTGDTLTLTTRDGDRPLAETVWTRAQ